MGRSKYDIDWDEFDDDEPEVPPYPSIYERSVVGANFAPSFKKCPHCDVDGNVVVGRMAGRTTKLGNEVQNKKTDHCRKCRGVGYLNVPTDKETKERLMTAGKCSDLVVLMRARKCLGIDLFDGPHPHEIRMTRPSLHLISVETEDLQP